jgi:hypothetical protein
MKLTHKFQVPGDRLANALYALDIYQLFISSGVFQCRYLRVYKTTLVICLWALKGFEIIVGCWGITAEE